MCLTPIYIKGSGVVPCGKCIECLMEYSTVWAYRCAIESLQYKDNAFITLTYNEDNLPERASLKKRDFQLFFKRLREHLSRFAIPINIRYFGCGEYGAKNGRPHGHFILFGWFPDDTFEYRVGHKIVLRSKLIEKCWDKGFVTVERPEFNTFKYCALYMQKGLGKVKDKEKPFLMMSTRPMIGSNFDVGSVFRTDKIYFNGKYIKTPRAFLRKLEKDYPDKVAELKKKRLSFLDRFSPELREDIQYKVIDEKKLRFSKIFGKTLDFCYRPLYNLKKMLKKRNEFLQQVNPKAVKGEITKKDRC